MENELSSCQKLAFDALQSKNNVFLTGGAGSGKSFLIRRFIKGLNRKSFPVLASTGAAAVLVGGRTFHSFFGLGIMEGGIDAVVQKALKRRNIVRRLQKLEGFILDEVSMISAETLQAAEEICRRSRDSEEPWGGVRVIAVGDFAQLPPVSRSQNTDWAFFSRVWEQTGFRNQEMKTIMRTNDDEFLEVLSKVRIGVVDDQVSTFLNERCQSVTDDFDGTRLFPRRDKTELYNLHKLESLGGEKKDFATEYFGKDQYIEALKKVLPISENLRLAINALVMIRQNDPKERWVNGSLGHVREFLDESILVELLSGRLIELKTSEFSMQNAEGETVAVAVNFPISLAYASTIHKAQGATIDRMTVDLRNLWEPGHAYVALSRVTSGEELYVDGWTESSIKVDQRVTDFYRNL